MGKISKQAAEVLAGLKPVEALAIEVASRDLKKTAREYVKAGTHEIDVTVRIAGKLVVKPDQPDAAVSSAPNVNHLVAFILTKLPARTRANLLRKLPEAFEQNGFELPAVDELVIDQVKGTLERLRKRETEFRYGGVSGEFQLTALDIEALALAGAGQREAA